MSLTGIYDEGSFQMLMRGLSQKKALTSSPPPA